MFALSMFPSEGKCKRHFRHVSAHWCVFSVLHFTMTGVFKKNKIFKQKWPPLSADKWGGNPLSSCEADKKVPQRYTAVYGESCKD